MHRVRVDDVEAVVGPASDKRRLAGPLGLEAMAVNYYALAPRESFAFGYHAHRDQEEAFYVIAGTATFETEAGEVTVGPGEAIAFAPGEYQRGWNRGDETVVALALGAPAGTGDTEVLVDCLTCGEPTPQRIERPDASTALTRCTACGTETARYG